MGLQLAVLNIAAVMLIPMVVMRAAGMTEAHLSWAVLASVRTMSSFLAIQRVLWRRKIRAVDFRAVQGAVAVDGVGNLLAGIAGTVPGSAPTTSVPLTQLTGGRRPRRGIGSDDLGGTGQRGEIHEAGAQTPRPPEPFARPAPRSTGP